MGPMAARKISLKEEGTNPITGKYHCPTCDKSYTDGTNMRRHYRFECGRPRYFQCYYCGKLMLRKGNIKDHSSRRHPNQPFRFEIIFHVPDS